MRQCWAVNQQGDRCQKPPGHKGVHRISIQWDDNECYLPGRPLAEVLAEAELPPPVAPTKCIACQHMHRGGECKCGCHEHIG